jgi:hypothetical protein
MTNATITPSAVAVTTRAQAQATPSAADNMRATIAAVNASAGANTVAVATLAALVVGAYRDAIKSGDASGVAPLTYVKQANEDGVDTFRAVVGSDASRRATLAVWALAGHGEIVKVDERTPALKSVGLYLSRAKQVATSLSHGYDGIATLASTVKAYDELAQATADSKAKAADAAYALFLLSLKPDERHAFATVAAIVGLDNYGKAHRSAFVRSMTPAKD